MIKGIDISSWQNPVDFSQLKSQIQFVIIKATEGTDYTNPFFQAHRQQAKLNGIATGFYHFARPENNNTPENEANYFINVVGNLDTGDVIALDWEPNWGGDADDYAVRFLNTVSNHYNGLKPIIYLSKNLQKSHNWSRTVAGGYGLWLADYENNGDASPWAVIAFQQTSSKGSVTGISGNIDMDVFYGDLNTFFKYGYHAPQSSQNTTPDTRDQQIKDLQTKLDVSNQQVQNSLETITKLNTEIAQLQNDTKDLNTYKQEIDDLNLKLQQTTTFNQDDINNAVEKQKNEDKDVLNQKDQSITILNTTIKSVSDVINTWATELNYDFQKDNNPLLAEKIIILKQLEQKGYWSQLFKNIFKFFTKEL